MAEPKVRFKRDDGRSYSEWRSVTIKDIVEKQSISVEVSADKFYREIGIRSHGKGLFHKEPIIGSDLGDKRVFEIIPDCLIVNIVFAWERAVAKTTQEEVGMIASHRFPMYKPKSGILYLDYIIRYFITDKGKQLLELASPGGAGRNRTLGQNEFANSALLLPCYEEQKKIADFLSSVDEVIVTSEAEVQNLEMQKKAMMKKIFSQEVRFKREDGTEFPEWEEKKVSELGSIIGGGTPKTSVEDYWNGDIPWISSADLEEDNVHAVHMSRFITDEAIDHSATKRVPAGSILIITRVGVGKVAIAPCDLCTSQDYMSIVLDSADIMFTGYALSKLMQDKVMTVQGTSIKGIPSDEIRGYSVSIPCLEEQRLIADFLSTFDETIAAAKKELELWKKLKKGLLQQMFV